MSEYRDLLPVVVETSGAVMPEGFDSWGIKSVHPDLMTAYNFSWASPGGVNVSNDYLATSNTSACPMVPGDGLCVATSWRGMASGGIPARTLLLIAYRAAEIVGRDEPDGKLRIGGEVASVALIDGERLIREHGEGANLGGACLTGANLRYANLQYANFQGANLQGAGLQYVNLQGANLQGAGLQYANLYGANLYGANLQGANLRGANLQGADLQDANIQGAELQGANVQGAYLQYANLQGGTPPDGWTFTDSGLLVHDEEVTQ